MKKKLLVTLLFVSLALLTACGGSVDVSEEPDTNQSEPEINEPTVYPLDLDSELLATTVGVPSIIYSTTAAENGLSGTAYYITGTVTDVVSEADSTVGVSYFIVQNGDGDAMFINLTDFFSDADDYSSVYYTGYDATFPESGEFVTVYGLYYGYSEVLNLPAFCYGLNEYQQKMLLNSVDDMESEVSETESESESTPETESESEDESEKESEKTDSESSTSEAESTTSETESLTIGQKNALSSAKSYLSFTSFSRSGLIDQLEYEGYTTDEATYAVDNCGADWYEQAALKAQEYIDFMAFSRSGLIDQLEFEGFTSEQAEYGVTAVGY